jgi:hypothetical protein
MRQGKETKMSVSIDLCETKVLVGRPDEKELNWVLDNGRSVAAYIVNVGQDGMPEELVKACRANGYDDEDPVLVVIQQ